MKRFIILGLLSSILTRCNDTKNQNCIVLKSLIIPTTGNIVSLKKDTVLNEYLLKDKYNSYVLSTYFTKNNIIYSGGELQLLKDTYSNQSTGNGFVLAYFTKNYNNYTFLEYRQKNLLVTKFIEIENTDENNIEELQLSNDTISKSTTKATFVNAKNFFNKNYIFDSIKTKTVFFNYLNRNEKWLQQSNSRQEEWVQHHFLNCSE